MKRSIALILGTAALALTMPAAAQDGVRGTPRQAARAMQHFSQCVVRREPVRAQQILGMDYRTPEYQSALRDFALSERSCLRGAELSFGGVLLAGSMAEAMLMQLLERRTLLSRLSSMPAATRPTARDDGESAAMCTVDTAPDQVATLFATDVGSIGERDAIMALTGPIADCLTPGTRASLNRNGIRAVLALAAYRLVQPAAAGASGS